MTISGNNVSQVFQVEANVTGSISDLTISDGSTWQERRGTLQRWRHGHAD